jgi:hypothetical protein
MIRELVTAEDGTTVEFLRPETQADIDELREASRKKNVHTGTSLADMSDETEQELIDAGWIDEDPID